MSDGPIPLMLICALAELPIAFGFWPMAESEIHGCAAFCPGIGVVAMALSSALILAAMAIREAFA